MEIREMCCPDCGYTFISDIEKLDDNLCPLCSAFMTTKIIKPRDITNESITLIKTCKNDFYIFREIGNISPLVNEVYSVGLRIEPNAWYIAMSIDHGANIVLYNGEYYRIINDTKLMQDVAYHLILTTVSGITEHRKINGSIYVYR